MNLIRKPSCAANRQQGVAAIEFALIAGILLLVFSGIITFSSLFLAQQKITHLVGDLSRQVTAQAMNPEEIAPFINKELSDNYGKGKAKSDPFLNWFGDLSAKVNSKACQSEPKYECAEIALKLDLEPGILSQTLDLLSSEQTQDDQLRTLSAKSSLVLRRQPQ